MPLISNEALRQVAIEISPYILPYVEAKGHITDEEIKLLAKKHASHKVGSARSLRKVQEYLCDM